MTQADETPFKDGYKNTDYILVTIEPLGTFQMLEWLWLPGERWQVSFQSTYKTYDELAFSFTIWDITADGLLALGLDPLRMSNIGWSYRGEQHGVPAEA